MSAYGEPLYFFKATTAQYKDPYLITSFRNYSIQNANNDFKEGLYVKPFYMNDSVDKKIKDIYGDGSLKRLIEVAKFGDNGINQGYSGTDPYKYKLEKIISPISGIVPETGNNKLKEFIKNGLVVGSIALVPVAAMAADKAYYACLSNIIACQEFSLGATTLVAETTTDAVLPPNVASSFVSVGKTTKQTVKEAIKQKSFWKAAGESTDSLIKKNLPPKINSVEIENGKILLARSSLNRLYLQQDLARKSGIPVKFNEVWGSSIDDLARYFELSGARVTRKPPAKGTSGTAQLYTIEGNPYVVEIQHSPASRYSTHKGEYYKFTIQEIDDRGNMRKYIEKIIDPDTYFFKNLENNARYFNKQGNEIIYNKLTGKWELK